MEQPCFCESGCVERKKRAVSEDNPLIVTYGNDKVWNRNFEQNCVAEKFLKM